MAEHVGQIPDVHRPAEVLGPVDTPRQVAHDRLTRHAEFVHEDVPRTHHQTSGLGEPAEACLLGRFDLQVVVDDGHLTVEHEVPEPGIGFEQIHRLVHQVDQLHAERLERAVPLAVPVGVRDDVDGAGHGRPA